MEIIKNITSKGTKDFSVFLKSNGGLLGTVDERYHDTLLDMACDVGNLDLVKFCVETDPSCIDYTDGLRLAIRSNEIEIVGYLLSKGFKLEGENGERAIHFACEYGDLAIVKLLVENGANLSLRDDRDFTSGLTPLEVAKKYQKEAVVNYLLALNQ